MITNKGYFTTAQEVYKTVKTAIAKTIEKAEQSIDNTIANGIIFNYIFIIKYSKI